MLERLRAARQEAEIEKVEILAHLARAVRAGVFMIPALIVGERCWYHAPPLEELVAALDATPSD